MNDRFKFRFFNKLRNEYENTYDLQSCEVLDYVIPEQCTGLKDKNGKLIYEGDWLKTKDDCYCYVVWYDGFWWVKSLPSEAMDLEHSEFYKECEVVGNIHNNPNFMEKNND